MVRGEPINCSYNMLYGYRHPMLTIIATRRENHQLPTQSPKVSLLVELKDKFRCFSDPNLNCRVVVSVEVRLEMDPKEKTRPLSALGELKVNDGMVSSVLLSILQTAGDEVMVGVGGDWEGAFIGVETGNVNTKPSEVFSMALQVQ